MKRPKFLLTLSPEIVWRIESGGIARRCSFFIIEENKIQTKLGWSKPGIFGIQGTAVIPKNSKAAAQLNSWTQALAEARREREAAEHYNPSNCR